jgi:hypothetical protein
MRMHQLFVCSSRVDHPHPPWLTVVAMLDVFACGLLCISELCPSQLDPSIASDAAARHADRSVRYQNIVLSMARQGLSVHDITSLPSGIALPLLDALQRCRVAPACDWPVEAYNLIGREDLARMAGAAGGADAIAISHAGHACCHVAVAAHVDDAAAVCLLLLLLLLLLLFLLLSLLCCCCCFNRELTAIHTLSP